MGCDDAIGATGVQFVEDGLGDGAAGRRLGAGTELVDEHERALVGHLQHGFHVREEGAVGGQVVLEGLVVSDGDHDAVEHGEFRSLRGGDEHTPLEHILKQSHGLQAHALAAGVGAGNKKDVLFGGK